jgi:signal transduction histidine kinase
MRLVLKLVVYAAAIGMLCWLARQIGVGIDRATEFPPTSEASRAYALFSLYLVTGAALAMFVAWDVSQFLGWQAERLFLGGGRLPGLTPAWWKAERLCKSGQTDEAVRILRDASDSHPRQWRINVRIAEIYQHNLANPLAAALEYEELLKRRLPRPARAWLMVRLAACYLVLHRVEESAMKLRAVMEQFPKTPAAKKAEQRLARMESGGAIPGQGCADETV